MALKAQRWPVWSELDQNASTPPDRARRIGEAGRRRFLAGRFSWRANAEAYLALFEEVSRGRATHTT